MVIPIFLLRLGSNLIIPWPLSAGNPCHDFPAVFFPSLPDTCKTSPERILLTSAISGEIRMIPLPTSCGFASLTVNSNSAEELDIFKSSYYQQCEILINLFQL